VTRLSSLARAELGKRIAGDGIRFQVGLFVIHLQSPIPSVADGIAALYADYPLLPPGGFSDFHIRIVYPRGLQRWWRRQAFFLFDGVTTFEPLPLEQAFPLFEWGLNWAITSRAHSYLIIHAAVVEKNGRAAILPAPPGSGKSTLCAALVQRGWRLLSDEMALLRLADGVLLPMARPVSLKNASIDVIQAFAPATQTQFSKPVRDTLKGTVAHLRAPADSVARAAEPARPAWIIYPKYEADAPLTLTPMPAARSFMALAGNAFNYSVLGRRGYDALAGVIEQTASFQLNYGALDEAIAAFDNLAAP
jgi:HprK-related kinase A